MRKHVSIFVPEGTASVAVTGPMDVLSEAGKYYMHLNPEITQPYFKVELVALNKKSVQSLGDYIIQCHKNIDEVITTNLVLIPNLTGDFQENINKNKRFIDWLKKQYSDGADIGAFCTGTFLLAATGLLNNKRATTHWMAVESFKNIFPNVKLLPDKIITDEGQLLCAGGSTSFFNLVLYLIERYCGHEVAIFMSKSMLIDMDKAPQNTYAIFGGQKNHKDEEILKSQEYIELRAFSKISIDELVKLTAYSRRTFIRKFKQSTGNTPSEYILRVKVEAAKRILEFENDTIREISFSLGYNDPGSFRNIFNKYVGISPNKYRKKFQSMKTNLG